MSKALQAIEKGVIERGMPGGQADDVRTDIRRPATSARKSGAKTRLQRIARISKWEKSGQPGRRAGIEKRGLPLLARFGVRTRDARGNGQRMRELQGRGRARQPVMELVQQLALRGTVAAEQVMQP